jgi:hypothetical protein
MQPEFVSTGKSTRASGRQDLHAGNETALLRQIPRRIRPTSLGAFSTV